MGSVVPATGSCAYACVVGDSRRSLRGIDAREGGTNGAPPLVPLTVWSIGLTVGRYLDRLGFGVGKASLFVGAGRAPETPSRSARNSVGRALTERGVGTPDPGSPPRCGASVRRPGTPLCGATNYPIANPRAASRPCRARRGCRRRAGRGAPARSAAHTGSWPRPGAALPARTRETAAAKAVGD